MSTSLEVKAGLDMSREMWKCKLGLNIGESPWATLEERHPSDGEYLIG